MYRVDYFDQSKNAYVTEATTTDTNYKKSDLNTSLNLKEKRLNFQILIMFQL